MPVCAGVGAFCCTDPPRGSAGRLYARRQGGAVAHFEATDTAIGRFDAHGLCDIPLRAVKAANNIAI